MKLHKVALYLLFVGLFTLPFNLAAQSTLTNGLIAYYPFNGNANDESGSNHNPVVVSATLAADRFVSSNKCYRFDGVTNVIETTAQFPTGSLPKTFTLWFNPSKKQRGWVLAGGADSDGQAFGLYEAASDGSFFFHGNGGSDLGIGLLSTNTWYHVAVAYDGAKVSCFINGTNKASKTVILNTTVSNIKIGRRQGSDGSDASPYFAGAIDEVRIYNRALTSNEISQLYAREASPAVPVIVQDTTNSFVVYGSNMVFSVAAASETPLRYQWYWQPPNGAGQAGAYAQRSATFIVGAIVTNGGFGYGKVPKVSFVGGGGAGAAGIVATSNGVVVDITVTNAGSGYTSVPAVVIDPPNGMLPGQTNSTLILNNATESNLGNYFAIISNDNGSVTSSIVGLTLVYPPSIPFGPGGYIGAYGSSNGLNCSVLGTPPFSFQWLLNGSSVVGATNSSYSVPSLMLANTGTYTVLVTNRYGTVLSGPANVYMSPSLIAPFSGAISLWGQNVPLTVGAQGSGALVYQWYFNGTPVPAATNATYTLNSIQFTNAGPYSVVVSSPYGSVTNAAFQVVVNPSEISMGLSPLIYLTGVAGNTYTIQRTTDLGNTNSWQTVTNITLVQPSASWSDTSVDTLKSENPRNFYRIIPGQ